MSEETLKQQLTEAQETIRVLQQELAETNREVMALTLDLEKRVDERTAEWREANRQLKDEIAERREAERALRASEERFRFLAENAVDVIWQMDTRMKFTYLSPSLHQIAGFKPEEWVGTHIWEHTPWREFFKMGRMAVRMMKKKELDPVTFETRMFNRDGDLIDLEIVAKPLKRDGRLIGFQGSTRDISRRKEAQRELQEYQEHLEEMVEERTQELRETQQQISEALELNRKIIESSSVGITAYDESGACVLANESSARIIGATEEQVLSQNFRHIGSWRDSSLLEAAEMALDEERITRKEVHVVSTFGKDAWLECRFVPFNLNGEPHLLVVTDDVTERRRLQDQLIRQEKLATLGRLSGSVSHELRNPLGAIRNAAYFLRLVVDEPDPDVQEALEILEREVDRSEAVIKAMLDFARSTPPVRRAVDLNGILERTLARLEIPAEVEVDTRLDDGVIGLQGDPDQLGEVFFNIAHNAIDAMPDGGKLIVESKMASPRTVTVSISDTGAGIPKHRQEQIFEPLFTTKTQGIGLGLAIVKALVEGHGGTVEVESPATGLRSDGEDEGTTFTVQLPLKEGMKTSEDETPSRDEE